MQGKQRGDQYDMHQIKACFLKIVREQVAFFKLYSVALLCLSPIGNIRSHLIAEVKQC